MTSLAFGFGILPLVMTTGAGAGAQNAIGTGVLGGMVTATVLVLIFSPLFYVLIETVFGKQYRGKTGGTDSPSLFDRLIEKIFGRRMEQKSASTYVTNPSEVI
jgi:HAE1 family hydrophobic/amphiphilic exporter-1